MEMLLILIKASVNEVRVSGNHEAVINIALL